MRRDDVPEEDALLEPELSEDAVDDRRTCFRGALAGQLPLRGERNAGYARAAVAGRFADEEQRGFGARLEIDREPPAAVLGA